MTTSCLASLICPRSDLAVGQVTIGDERLLAVRCLRVHRSASETSGEFSITSTTILTFTPGDWDQAQTVTVQATDDDVDDGQQFGTVTNNPSGGGYDSVANVTVTINEPVGQSGPAGRWPASIAAI